MLPENVGFEDHVEQHMAKYLVKNPERTESVRPRSCVFVFGEILAIEMHASCPTVSPMRPINTYRGRNNHTKLNIFSMMRIHITES